MTVEDEFQKKFEEKRTLKNNTIYELESMGFCQVEEKENVFRKFIKDNICFDVSIPFNFKIFRLELRVKKGYVSSVNISRLMTGEDLINAINLIEENLIVFECVLLNMTGNIRLDLDYFPRQRTYRISDAYGRKMYLDINFKNELSLFSNVNESCV